MANQKQQKEKCLALADILRQYSDEQHFLSCDMLIRHLAEKGFSAERKSVYADLNILRASGMDIRYQPKKGYRLASRPLDAARLKLLCDLICSSGGLDDDQTRELCRMLADQCSIYQRQTAFAIPGPIPSTPSNPEFLDNVAILLEAIRQDVEIEFRYFDLTVHRQKQYRRRRRYRLLPYALIWENQHYYCVGTSSHHSGFSHYRVDKMEQIRPDNIPREKIPFDAGQYAARTFGMFSSPPVNMTLRFDLSLVNTVFDRFGQDILITRIGESWFELNVTTSPSAPFLGWLFQFGSRAAIIAPAQLKEQMKKAAQDVLRGLETDENHDTDGNAI